MELLPEYQRDPVGAHAALRALVQRASWCRSRAVAKLDAAASARSRSNHLGQLPSVTISFNLQAGRLARRRGRTRSEKLAAQTLPATITTSFQGTAQAFQSSLQGLGMLLLMAMLVIYMVLGILYESFIHPLTILSGAALRRLRRAA